MSSIRIPDLFDLNCTLAADLFEGMRLPWEALARIGEYIRKRGATLSKAEFDHPTENVWIAKDAAVAETAYLKGPLIVDSGAEIRHSAYIRGNVIVGKNAVVGNSTELKNCILFDGVQVPHFNYVGDSILGAYAHMGAGAVTSNIRSDKKNIIVHGENEIHTGLRKLGAMVGNRAEVGCGSVLNPGVILGRDSIVYPASCVRGVVAEKCIFKASGEIVRRREG